MFCWVSRKAYGRYISKRIGIREATPDGQAWGLLSDNPQHGTGTSFARGSRPAESFVLEIGRIGGWRHAGIHSTIPKSALNAPLPARSIQRGGVACHTESV